MSKAEKFIKDCIRNCSNTFADVNYAKDIKPKGVLEKVYQPWLTPDQARKAVEIAREEMIEIACEYLDGLIEIPNDREYQLKKERIIGRLKQAMKNE